MLPETNADSAENTTRTSGVQVYCAQFDATLSELSRVCAEIGALAETRAGADWAAEINLGLTEALSNVVRHAYDNTAGRISLSCVETEEAWLLTLNDNGVPIPQERVDSEDESVFDFDPQDLQSLPEGGMGLALIRRCFDRVSYQAGRDGNCLSLVKMLPAPARIAGVSS